jgi:LysR family glycine cleavage system transcriptional activator
LERRGKTFRKLPPLAELAAFEAIARHRSFTKAAKELFLTPSAISQRIRQLEARFDTRLFVRTRRSVTLTATGVSYLESVQDSLARLAAASDRLARPCARPLCVGIVPALASNWLIYKLRSFHQQHPEIDLQIQAAIGMANLKAGEIDVAIRWEKAIGQTWKSSNSFQMNCSLFAAKRT